MFSSWPVWALVAGVKIGSGQALGLREALGKPVAADLAGGEVVLPPGAGQVAADDAFDREHLEPPALGRAPVLAQGDQVVRDDRFGLREPEGREPGEDAALVGDLRRQHDVEGRDAVAGHEEQALVVEGVDLADLAAGDVARCFRHEPAPFGRECAGGRRRCRRTGRSLRGRRRCRARPDRGAR